ncbi:MAG: ABC transporter permease [Flavobacteriaceae bacterium]|jgi:putative ABC transport system permease protein|nr:ABC transporter permease [Flavobacteriaceae bacterium]
MFTNWFKLYLKNIGKNKVFAVLNVLGMSVGITALILSVLYWKHEKSYDQWNPYKDNVYEVYRNLKGEPSPWLPAPLANQLDKQDIVESYCYIYHSQQELSINVGTKKDYLYDIANVQATFFDFFPFEEVYGTRKDYATNWKNAIAIDIEQAERVFGKGVNPVGKSIVLNDGQELSIRLVYKVQGNSSLAPKSVMSYITENEIAQNRVDNWSDWNYNLLIKLKEGVVMTDVHQKLENDLFDPLFEIYAKDEGLSKEAYKKAIKEDILSFHVLDEVHLNPLSTKLGAGATASKMLYMLIGAATLLLLLSILNAVNLSLVTGFNRAKEVGIRKTLGSTKKQLIAQFIFESGLTISFSMLLSLVLVEVILPYFNVLINRSIVFYIIDFIPLLVVITIVLVFVFVIGILPALFIASFDTLKVLKGNYMRGKSGVVIRNTLLVFQFFIAFFFLTITLFVNKQVNYMLDKDLGFSGQQVINIQFKGANVNNKDELFKRVVSDFKNIKGVKNVTEHSIVFGSSFYSSSTNFIGDQSFQSGNMIVDYDFVKVFDLTIKEGRFFDERYSTDASDKIVVNEAFVRAFNLTNNALGKEVTWNNKKFQIIGVLRDMNTEGFATEVAPCTYFLPTAVNWFHNLINTVSVKIEPNDIQGTLQEIETFWKNRVDNTYPIKYTFANQDFENSYKDTMYQRVLFIVLTGVSVFIALFGLIAIVAFSIQNRLKEVAIRKVLGAETKELIYQLTKRYFMYCLLGFVLSVYPAIYLLNMWLQGFAYHIELDWLPFLISWCVLSLFSLFLVSFKALKATRINVLKYINYE